MKTKNDCEFKLILSLRWQYFLAAGTIWFLGLNVFMPLEAKSQEISRTLKLSSSSDGPQAAIQELDTATVTFPPALAKTVFQETGVQVNRLEVALVILNPTEAKFLAILSGTCVGAKGEINGVKSDSSARFCPLLAVADSDRAYGLGLYTIRNNLTEKAVSVRVEFELKHDVRRGLSNDELAGLVRWGDVEEVAWDTILVGENDIVNLKRANDN